MKKPLSFGMTMLASALGVVIVSVVFGLLMLIMTIVMVVSIGSTGDKTFTPVKPGTFLVLNLGDIAGDRSDNVLTSLFNDGEEVGLVEATAAVRQAATDDNILGLLIKDDGPIVSWASMEELRTAVTDFRQSGKPVVSYSTSYSQEGYYLATAGDIVSLHPTGMVDFRGIGGEVMYYKEMLDKLGVEMQLIRPESCSYKSAGEVYTLNHMSDANREQLRSYISGIWRTVTAAIADSRHLEVAELNRIADNLSGYLADDARARHLVDTLCFEEDIRAMLKKTYGGKQLLPIDKYADNCWIEAQRNTTKDAIAVIYAEGNVMEGSARGMDYGVYGDDIVKSLREATDDDDVKAIVLRVNSPGGMATASESMTHAVIQARAKKPVIVSMGDLAASAGYEMSCMADVIVAHPMTITGSIGVFGTIPNIGKLMRQKLGLNTDTVTTNHNAAALSILRPLSPTALEMMNRNVEDFYKVFVGRVAEGRHMSYDAVHQIARGRVWIGADAKGNGLVDTLGGLDLALRIASERAGISDYAIKNFPEEKDLWTQLSELFGESADDDLNLLAKARMAWKWRNSGKKMKTLSRIEQDMLFVSESEGLQARMPFIVLD